MSTTSTGSADLGQRGVAALAEDLVALRVDRDHPVAAVLQQLRDPVRVAPRVRASSRPRPTSGTASGSLRASSMSPSFPVLGPRMRLGLLDRDAGRGRGGLLRPRPACGRGRSANGSTRSERWRRSPSCRSPGSSARCSCPGRCSPRPRARSSGRASGTLVSVGAAVCSAVIAVLVARHSGAERGMHGDQRRAAAAPARRRRAPRRRHGDPPAPAPGRAGRAALARLRAARRARPRHRRSGR